MQPAESYPDAATQANTGDPCPPNWLYVYPGAISGQQNKPQGGSGGWTPWVLRMIHDNGQCPTDWMAGKPAAEQAWLCAAISYYYGLYLASKGKITPNPSYGQPQGCFPNIPFSPWDACDEINATGHCSADVFGISCQPGTSALQEIQAGEQQPLVLGTQPAPGVTSANFAPAPMLPAPPINTPGVVGSGYTAGAAPAPVPPVTARSGTPQPTSTPAPTVAADNAGGASYTTLITQAVAPATSWLEGHMISGLPNWALLAAAAAAFMIFGRGRH